MRDIFEQRFNEAKEKLSTTDIVYKDIEHHSQRVLQREINTALGKLHMKQMYIIYRSINGKPMKSYFYC